MAKRNENRPKIMPLLRVRHLVIISACVALLIAGPLFVVWKQVYINQMSVTQNRLSDTLLVLNKQAARLRFSVEKSSSTGRIETIARQNLNLEYPNASQIVIIKQGQRKKATPDSMGNYLAALRRSIGRGRG